MQTKVTARHFDLTPEIRDRAEEEIGGLTRYFENIISAELILDVEKHRRKAELIVKISNHTLSGSGETEDMSSAIEVAGDKVKAQLKKHKGKMKNRQPEVINEITEAITRPSTNPEDIDV